MKILISLSVFAVASVFGVNIEKNVQLSEEDALVNAYRLTDYNDIYDDTDNEHAYFDDLDCANYFQTLHPEYWRNGKATVPEEWVFTNCQL
ncbi:hypothetical protein [Flavobacterium rhizosphaerae]|uniref:Uncharacterized protein n=1 Tax=Flavobacterium rhizosphaerae TaxID=3163298 RepID=A0ABW8YTV8_9FLAO